MFEVLNFVYDNYWQCDDCPDLPALHRQLRQVGFDTVEIEEALVWIEDLKLAVRQWPELACAGEALHTTLGAPSNAMRLFSAAEQARLDQASWGFLIFLESVGALTAERLELVMERVLATPDAPLGVDEIKLIVLMVFWSLGEEPNALVLDELCDNPVTRAMH